MVDFLRGEFRFHSFDITSQTQFKQVSVLIDKNLSEPYSNYVYWYFFHQWPEYCFLVSDENTNTIIGVIINKVEPHRDVRKRGYIGMLVIDPANRGIGLAKDLIKLSIEKMREWDQVDEIMLETEVTNNAALHLYELFGFLRAKRLYRYYLNAHDAFRLILPLRDAAGTRVAFLPTIDDSSSNANGSPIAI